MKTNYHTHTYRCKHATGTDEKYLTAAREGGFELLGFSDHCPFPYEDGFHSNSRMELFLFEDYLASMEELRQKYSGSIKLLRGVELDFFPKYSAWAREFVREKRLDYVIFGNHFYPDDRNGGFFGRSVNSAEMLELYLDCELEGMEQEDYCCIAHPDLFMRAYPVFDDRCERASRRICERAAKYRIPLEYNLSGFYQNPAGGVGYPCDEFWRIAADSGCTAVIGCDAHSPAKLSESAGQPYADAVEYLAKLGIKRYDTLKLLGESR